MSSHFAIAQVASLVGEPSRAAILLHLLDGSAQPAGELARAAGLSAAAASLHLAKLAAGGLIVGEKRGRHRYYRLTSGDVARAVEALGAVATAPPPARSVTDARQQLRLARSCYDHLAGVVAVQLGDQLVQRGLVRKKEPNRYEVTGDGARWFQEVMGIDMVELSRRRRALALSCLDLTERRPHVAGALGAALLERFLADRWVARRQGTRALRITTRGRAEFERLGVRV